MKRLLTLTFLLPLLFGCSNPDARASHTDDCKKDSALLKCAPLHAISITPSSISRANDETIVITLSRPMQSLSIIDLAFTPAREDTVSDQILAVRVRQPDKSITMPVPASQIVLGSNLGQAFNTPNQIIVMLLSSDLRNLIPNEQTVIEVDLIDWQGNTLTESLPLIINL